MSDRRQGKPPPAILIEAQSKVLGVVIAIIENHIEHGEACLCSFSDFWTKC
jgi:hypothetical protein